MERKESNFAYENACMMILMIALVASDGHVKPKIVISLRNVQVRGRDAICRLADVFSLLRSLICFDDILDKMGKF